MQHTCRGVSVGTRCILREVKNVKKEIHPKHDKAVVKCACGETFETLSAQSSLNVDICSKCHPFFTGRQKLIDSGGRVDKFKKRLDRK